MRHWRGGSELVILRRLLPLEKLKQRQIGVRVGVARVCVACVCVACVCVACVCIMDGRGFGRHGCQARLMFRDLLVRRIEDGRTGEEQIGVQNIAGPLGRQALLKQVSGLVLGPGEGRQRE